MAKRFTDKVAIVTGGGAGIGAAICRRLSSEGARVVVADVDQDAAQRLSHSVGNSLAAKVGAGHNAPLFRMSGAYI